MGMMSHILIPLVGMSLFLSSCGLFNHTENQDVLTIGSTHVSLDDLKKDIRRLSIEMDGDGQAMTVLQSEWWLNQIVDHYLILEYGRENEVTISVEEVEEAVNKIKQDIPQDDFKNILLQGYIDFQEWKETFKRQLLINKIIKTVLGNITLEHYDEIKKYYESHTAEFRHPPMVKFRQIVTRTKAQADEVRQKIEQGSDMAALAKQYSVTPEGKNGGEVGWIEKGILDETLEQAIFPLGVGKISPVIGSPFGFHVVKMMAVRNEGVRSLPEVRREIEAKLLYQKRETYYRDWLSQLHRKYPVVINYELLKTLELKP